MEKPTFHDVLEARSTIAPYVRTTPLISYAGLNKLLDAKVYIKHENHHPLGAFKIRGGVNLLAHLSDKELRGGVVTASTGNHGQSIAYSCGLFGAKATIVVPEGANSLKVESMQNLGAEVVFHGRHFDEARQHVERLATKGYRYIHSANEPLLIAGVATCCLEIIEECPNVDYIFVPMGGGSGAAGACIAAKAVNPNIKIIAVQSEEAPAGYLSWRNRSITEAPMATIAEGLATQTGYTLTQSILWNLLDDFLLVSDSDIENSIAILIEKAHTLAEAAGAAALAGALQTQKRLSGKKVALIVSGGNITLDQLKNVMELRSAG